MSMVLTVEDGSGLPNADSYISAADATTYWTNRLNARWSLATDDEVNAALLVATQYIDLHYNFRGVQSSNTQSLQFPRSYPETSTYSDFYVSEIFAGNSIQDDTSYESFPVAALGAAACEAALRALDNPLIADVAASFTTSVQVDVVKQTFSRISSQIAIPIVDRILDPYTETNSTYSFRLNRG